MKLVSKKTKATKTVIIVVISIVVVLALVGAGYFIVNSLNSDNGGAHQNGGNGNPNVNGNEIDYIRVSVTPSKSTYYVGEAFDPMGTKIQVVTKDTAYTYFVDYTKLEFSGFDSSIANDSVAVTVSYKGFTTTLKVKVAEISGSESSSTNPDVVNVEAFMFTTYTKDEWNTYGPSDLDAYIVLTYADGTVFGSVEETPIKRGDMYVQDEYMNAPGITYVTITYELNGYTYEVTVPITITN